MGLLSDTVCFKDCTPQNIELWGTVLRIVALSKSFKASIEIIPVTCLGSLEELLYVTGHLNAELPSHRVGDLAAVSGKLADLLGDDFARCAPSLGIECARHQPSMAWPPGGRAGYSSGRIG